MKLTSNKRKNKSSKTWIDKSKTITQKQQKYFYWCFKSIIIFLSLTLGLSKNRFLNSIFSITNNFKPDRGARAILHIRARARPFEGVEVEKTANFVGCELLGKLSGRKLPKLISPRVFDAPGDGLMAGYSNNSCTLFVAGAKADGFSSRVEQESAAPTSASPCPSCSSPTNQPLCFICSEYITETHVWYLLITLVKPLVRDPFLSRRLVCGWLLVSRGYYTLFFTVTLESALMILHAPPARVRCF